ncbi:unnamed protein product [Ectocarpus sp. CCAP 1310/34]|nr:unnamed protein product [Ectocarpus sp. CCAP 1310/34]
MVLCWPHILASCPARGVLNLTLERVPAANSSPSLYLYSNELTTLPEGIFGGLTALEELYLYSNELTMLPEGIFGGLTALEELYLYDNILTTLPQGIFGDLTALTLL